MTKGAQTETKLVRIQEKGQVTLPAEARRRLGLKKGDLVAVTETPDGFVITPQEVIATRSLDRIGELLREKGISLEEMIESGREERGSLLREMYGIPADEQGD
jgi:AbrB family looped-hinge helix DNA binding protein